MKEQLFMILAFIAGIALGVLFFYGLWLTVKKMMTSKAPALWVLGSFLVRTGITLTGFYYVSQGNLLRLLICLLGFVACRYIVKRFVSPNEESQLQLKKEAGHES